MANKIDLPKKGQLLSVGEVLHICKQYGRIELYKRILADQPAKPFASDGCSAWPDEWHGIDFYEDCFLHDIEYWCGGTDADKLAADLQLALGICRKGAPRMAEIMFNGVRVGGVDWMPTPWRWGFGR
jgi:hypothetical protein